MPEESQGSPQGPFPPPTPPVPRRRSRTWLWAGLAGGFAALLLLGLWVGRGQERAKREACWHGLRSLGIASHLYADDYDGAFEGSLDQLYTGKYTDVTRMFSCPSAPSQYRDFNAGKVTERSSSYAYLPGMSSSMPGGFILAYDKTPENHRKFWLEGGRNVLHIDSSVDWWPASREPEFQRRLVLQNEAVTKWRASGKPVEAFGEFISPELQRMMNEDVAKGVSDAGR